MKANGNNEMDLMQAPKRIVMTFKDKQEDANYILQMLSKANDKDYGDPVTFNYDGP